MYPIGNYVKGKRLYLSTIHILEGKEKDKQKYINYLKKHKDVLRLEIAQNLIFTLVKEKYHPEEYQLVYNPHLFFPAPMINDVDGYEIWEVALWERERLQDIIKMLKNSKIIIDYEISRFVNKKLDEIYLMQLLPKLSPRQREVIEFAAKEGYYKFPKKTNLIKLAKSMKISKAAVHELLAKAEAKLIPFLMR